MHLQFENAANLSSAFASWLRWMIQPTLDQRLASAAAALQALEQEQPIRDSFPPVVSEPTRSSVIR
jgi:hypothetical protein